MDFHYILKEHGLKSTPQRITILSEIYTAGHLDMEKLYAKVTQSIKVPLGTLYRVLSELTTANVIAPLTISGLKTHYEIVKQEHSHFVCDGCGKIEDVDIKTKELAQIEMLQKKYHVNSVSVTVHGLCANCVQK